MPQPHLLRLPSPFARIAMPVPLTDSRIVALARTACAEHRPLRLIFLRGYWRAADLRRVAAAAVALGLEIGDIAPTEASTAKAQLEHRLAALIADAPLVGDGANSLAEHLGGRAPERADRLRVIPSRKEEPAPAR